MISFSTHQQERIERWSPILFIVGGLLVVIFAAANWANWLTDANYQTVGSIAGPAGFVLGFVALLGLSLEVANRAPRLARVGAIFAVLGAVGFLVSILATLGEVAGVLPAQPAWAPAYLALIFGGSLIGFPAFAAAILRTGVYSRTLGYLLLAPPLLFVAVLVFNGLGLPEWTAPVIASAHALSLLAIGYVLRARDDVSKAREPTAA